MSKEKSGIIKFIGKVGDDVPKGSYNDFAYGI